MRTVVMCEYCGYIGAISDVLEHEKHCIGNPEIKCCENCRYSYEESYSVCCGNTSHTPFYCIYKQIVEDNEFNKAHAAEGVAQIHINPSYESLPEEHICAHYERDTPRKIMAV